MSKAISWNENLSAATLIVILIFCFSKNSSEAQNYQPQNFRTYASGFGSMPPSSNYAGAYGNLNQISQTQARSAQNLRSMPQQNTSPSLEQALNAIDNPAGWNRTPVSGAPPTTNPNRNSPMSGIMPGISKKEVMRVFLEGGSPQMGSPGPRMQESSSYNNSGNVYADYQTAENEASKARNQESRARNGSDQWNRKNAASQADYAARNANYAASRAESASYNGDQKAQSYARLARQAANRARASADRARYNADTIR